MGHERRISMKEKLIATYTLARAKWAAATRRGGLTMSSHCEVTNPKGFAFAVSHDGGAPWAMPGVAFWLHFLPWLVWRAVLQATVEPERCPLGTNALSGKPFEAGVGAWQGGCHEACVA